MWRDAMLEGEIPNDGIVTRLSAIAETCVTGVLRFEGLAADEDKSGEVVLVRGQIAVDQPRQKDGADPVEVLLALRGGTFSVYQSLPPLPVSSGDRTTRAGSLAVHVPAGLMSYCERAGLTGTLSLSRMGREKPAMRETVKMRYVRGELDEIRCQRASAMGIGTVPTDADAEDDMLQRAFGWDDGTFTITAEQTESEHRVISPRGEPTEHDPAPERGDSTAQHFLRVVEMSLDDLLKERAQRTKKRTGPQLPALPAARAPERKAPSADFQLGVSTKADRGEATVKVIYLQSEMPPPLEAAPGTMLDGAQEASELPAEEAAPPDADAEEPAQAVASAEVSIVADGEAPNTIRVTAISAIDDAGIASSRPPGAIDDADPISQLVRDDEDATTEFQTARAKPRKRLPTAATGPEITLESNAPDNASPNATAPAPDDEGPLMTVAWVGFTIVALVVALAILAKMPAL